MGLELFQEGVPELQPAGDGALGERAEPPQGEVSQTGGKDLTVQVILVPPYRHPLDEVLEVLSRPGPEIRVTMAKPQVEIANLLS